MYTLLDPKFAVEPISEVPGASKAHLEAVKRNVTNLLKQRGVALTAVSKRDNPQRTIPSQGPMYDSSRLGARDAI